LYKQGSPLGSETDPATSFRTAIYRPNDWLNISVFQSLDSYRTSFKAVGRILWPSILS